MNASEINGKYQKVNEIKQERSNQKELQDKLTDEIIAYVEKHGQVLAYKGNDPYVLSVKKSYNNKFDKKQLSIDLGIAHGELDPVGIAKLVEDGRVTSEKLNTYWYEEEKETLRQKKATKRDMERLQGVAQ